MRHMPDDEPDYNLGPGRRPLHTRFRKGQSGNPGGRSKKNLPALLAGALNEPVFVTITGRRRKITKREAVIHQLSANLPMPICARRRCRIDVFLDEASLLGGQSCHFSKPTGTFLIARSRVSAMWNGAMMRYWRHP